MDRKRSSTPPAGLRTRQLVGWLSAVALWSGVHTLSAWSDPVSDPHPESNHTQPEQPFVYHMVQAALWQTAVHSDEIYYPPTYDVDGFTHGTSNPAKLLNVANHFYRDVPGEWLCLQMTVDSLAAEGVATVYEGTAPVGDKPADFEGAGDELFPHIQGGIAPAAVISVFPIERSADGEFLSIPGVTSGDVTAAE